MTIAQMIAKVKARTKQVNQSIIIQELQTAYNWAHNRIFNTERGPDLFRTDDEEIAVNARIRTYDLTTLDNPFLAIKQLWLKLPTDTDFTPMVAADENMVEFIRNDSESSSDTTVTAQGHPVFYDVYDFNQVRFAPAIPAGSAIRIDYFRLASDPDDAGDQLSVTMDLPEVFHEAVTAKTTALVFDDLDDDRSANWESRSNDYINNALFVQARRTQSPTVTQPFRFRRRRYI